MKFLNLMKFLKYKNYLAQMKIFGSEEISILRIHNHTLKLKTKLKQVKLGNTLIEKETVLTRQIRGTKELKPVPKLKRLGKQVGKKCKNPTGRKNFVKFKSSSRTGTSSWKLMTAKRNLVYFSS